MAAVIRLRADFNEATGDEIWTSLRRAFLPRRGLARGDVVELWDGEGTTVDATVESVRDPIVFLRMDLSTWREREVIIVKGYKSPASAAFVFEWVGDRAVAVS